MVKAERSSGRLGEVWGFIDGLYGPDLQAKRVDALASATFGVMAGASLAVAMIGQALAQARGLVPKHAVKQVDRLMSNQGIDVWDCFARWVPSQIGAVQDGLVAMDWTDFDHDGQSTLVLSLVTGHGRAAPLIWLSVWKDETATRRNDHEDACLVRLAETVLPGTQVTILADRGFGDQKLFAFLGGLGFGYVIRVRGNIRVTDADGETRPAAEWVGHGGRARKLRAASETAQPFARGHGARAPGGCGHVRAGQGHEGALVPGRKRSRGDGGRAGQPRCPPLDGRTQLPRHQGPPLRHGAVLDPHRRADPAPPSAAGQRVRRGAADVAWNNRREPRHGPAAQVQHQKYPQPLAVPPGLHVLRTDPQHARAPACAAHDSIRQSSLTRHHVQQPFCPNRNEGMIEPLFDSWILFGQITFSIQNVVPTQSLHVLHQKY